MVNLYCDVKFVVFLLKGCALFFLDVFREFFNMVKKEVWWKCFRVMKSYPFGNPGLSKMKPKKTSLSLVSENISSYLTGNPASMNDYLDPRRGANGWERVPLSNPLVFKHHPLEGAGIYVLYHFLTSNVLPKNLPHLFYRSEFEGVSVNGATFGMNFVQLDERFTRLEAFNPYSLAVGYNGLSV